jgi:hypothetical protein
MVLLPKITEDAIVENLKKRYMDDYIFVSLPVNLEVFTEYVLRYLLCNEELHILLFFPFTRMWYVGSRNLIKTLIDKPPRLKNLGIY